MELRHIGIPLTLLLTIGIALRYSPSGNPEAMEPSGLEIQSEESRTPNADHLAAIPAAPRTPAEPPAVASSNLTLTVTATDSTGQPWLTCLTIDLGLSGAGFSVDAVPDAQGSVTIQVPLDPGDLDASAPQIDALTIYPTVPDETKLFSEMYFAAPADGLAAFAENVALNGALVGSAAMTLSMPPLYGTINLDSPAPSGSRVEFERLNDDGHIPSFTGDEEEAEGLDVTSQSFKVYSWSKASGAITTLRDGNGRLVGANTLRAGGTTLIEIWTLSETTYWVDPALHPTAWRILAFDSSTYAATTPSQIATGRGVTERLNEALWGIPLNGGVIDPTYKQDTAFTFELWGCHYPSPGDRQVTILGSLARPSGGVAHISFD